MDRLDRPAFEVSEGAPPGTEQAFLDLIALIQQQPTEMSVVFNSLGLDGEKVVAERHSNPGDESPPACLGRLVGTILYEAYDLEVEFDETINYTLRREVEVRNGLPRHARRMRRLGLFVGSVAAASPSVPQEPKPLAEAA